MKYLTNPLIKPATKGHHMTPAQAKALFSLIAAVAEGKTIQWKSGIGIWHDTQNIEFNFNMERYRVKPEVKYRPWTADEVPVGQVVRRKIDGGRFIIESAYTSTVYIGGASYNTISLSEYFTMDNGSECGIEVSE